MILFKKILKIIIVCILLFILFVASFNRFYVSFQQKYYNNKLLQNKSQYTIMCLGESTTAGQYPIQLQQILDKKYPNKFSVVDCGIPGTTLETILDLLDNNIDKYKPNIAICMMGGNYFIDFNYQNSIHSQNKFRILKNFIKMFIVFKNNIKSLFHNDLLFADNNNDTVFLDYYSTLKKQRKYKEIESLLKNILKNDPNNEFAFSELTSLFADFSTDARVGYNIAYAMSKEAINKGFSFNKDSYYRIIFKLYFYFENNIDYAQTYINQSISNEIQYYIDKALNEDFDIFSSASKYNLYEYIKKYITDEQKNKILNVILTNDAQDFGLLAIEALGKKDYQKAQEYFDKAEEIRLKFPNLKTYDLYKRIVKKLIDNNIKVICMQYPIRSIVSLQEQLKNEPYYDRITFISNEKLFKDALMKQDYYDIFADSCSGDFGHCKVSGNTMIAENVVDTLENLLDLKEKKI